MVYQACQAVVPHLAAVVVVNYNWLQCSAQGGAGIPRVLESIAHWLAPLAEGTSLVLRTSSQLPAPHFGRAESLLAHMQL